MKTKKKRKWKESNASIPYVQIVIIYSYIESR